jgi:hypothetical protein
MNFPFYNFLFFHLFVIFFILNKLFFIINNNLPMSGLEKPEKTIEDYRTAIKLLKIKIKKL